MQTTCSRCSQDIFVKDDKLPPVPFMLKCPQCKNTMKMPGKPKASESTAPKKEKTATPAPAPQVAAKSDDSSRVQAPPPVEKVEKTESVAPASPEAPSSSETEKAPSPKPTPLSLPPVDKVQNQASTEGNEKGAGSIRALIELSESEQSGAVETMLRRQGYEIERLRSWREQSSDVQQGRYSVVFTHQNGSPKSDGVQFLINGLAPEVRREIFVVLVGDAFKTGDGTQAFVAQVDLVCRPDDLGDADTVLRSTITEKHRLYRAYAEAQSKRAAGKL